MSTVLAGLYGTAIANVAIYIIGPNGTAIVRPMQIVDIYGKSVTAPQMAMPTRKRIGSIVTNENGGASAPPSFDQKLVGCQPISALFQSSAAEPTLISPSVRKASLALIDQSLAASRTVLRLPSSE